ncbi:PREDICTED: protein SET DOMAIN GROUP 40 isoform X2 [Nelumbo nucifera]|uniref:Protein SET DOMAIN GROUP 40 isoform X2 n=1 Tax=Nelumbo nucifera TaxID=4432 RepID=A0A1U7ZET1_NELNU|nr:PREDICTED: protein SET DOMAIN GROUP 40 isoform X2 [Nelumbo nucifera]
MGGEAGNLETFLKWASQLGISDSTNPLQSTTALCLGNSLFVSHFPDAGGRGLAAARELRKGELILRVPKSALMTRESLLTDQKLAISVNGYSHLSSTQILAVCLLAEIDKGKASMWYPYLVQLPRSYNILASFTWFETQALQVEDAVWAAEKARSKAELDWKESVPVMKELELRPQLLTFKSWLWASATISSRTLHIPWDDAGCLCPVGDFFNYAAPEEAMPCSEDLVSWKEVSSLKFSYLWKFDAKQFNAYLQRLTDGGYEEDISAYCFYARKSYKIGEQVLLSYGTYTNLELLEHYGFILDMNPNDKAFIELDAEICSSSSWSKDTLYIQQDGKPSFTLLSALRLWATPPNQRKSVAHYAYSGSQLSAENEMSAMRWMAKNCQILLNKFPTKVEDDDLLLHIIDKMQNFPLPKEVEYEQMMLAFGGEVGAFFEANGLQKGGSGGDITFSRKMIRSIERWKLVVQWRLRYKKILVDCISYCTEVVDFLSSENLLPNRSNNT